MSENKHPSENEHPLDSAQEFLSDVEQLLVPTYAECSSNETLKVRKSLLVISFVLILSALGLITVGQVQTKVPALVGMTVNITNGIRWVLVALCSYFLILHSLRSYGEWKLWRLRHQAPIMGLRELSDSISTQLAKRYADINEKHALTIQLYLKLQELTQDPPELVNTISRRDALYSEYRRLGDNLRLKEKQLQPREFEDEASKLDQMSQEFNRLSDEVDRQRNEYKARIAERRDALERQLHEALKNSSVETSGPEEKALSARLEYLYNAMQPIKKLISLRFRFEVIFPTAFAIVAIVIGVLAP